MYYKVYEPSNQTVWMTKVSFLKEPVEVNCNEYLIFLTYKNDVKEKNILTSVVA